MYIFNKYYPFYLDNLNETVTRLIDSITNFNSELESVNILK